MTDVLDLLRAADPAAERRPDPGAAARMDAAVRLRAAGVLPSPRAATSRRRRRAWLAAVALPIAGGAVAAALALTPGAAPSAFRPQDATAAEALDAFRSAAAQRAGETDGRYAYTETLRSISHMRPKAGGGGSFVEVIPQREEVWVDDDGRGVLRLTDDLSRRSYPTAEDRAAAEAAGPLLLGSDRTVELQRYRVAGLTLRQLRALPTTPAALGAELNLGRPVDDAAWPGLLPKLAQVLQTPMTPDRVRDAAYELLETAPGAAVLPDVEDPLGRHGVGIAFGDDAWDVVLVFDPQTGRPMGTRSIGKKELPGRTITDWALQLDAGRTDTAPEPRPSPVRAVPPPVQGDAKPVPPRP